MNILAARVFGRVETVFLVKIESNWIDNLKSKLFHIFKKLHNWKNLVSTLVNIQGLLIGGIMGEDTGSRSKFDSIPFHKLCLKFTI